MAVSPAPTQTPFYNAAPISLQKGTLETPLSTFLSKLFSFFPHFPQI